MLGTSALKKLFFAEQEGDTLYLKRGYHSSTHWDQFPNSAFLEYSSAVMPPNAFKISTMCMSACFLSCLLSRGRHSEKWWLCGLALGVGYYSAVKCHKVGNGCEGHTASMWCDVAGMIGFMARLIAKNGNRNFNAACLLAFSGLAWYDLGRFHMWSAWLGEYKKERTTGHLRNIWTEYTPSSAEPELLPFRSVQNVAATPTLSKTTRLF